jgi:cytochrome c5
MQVSILISALNAFYTHIVISCYHQITKGKNMKKITSIMIALLATFTMINANEPTGQAVFDSKCVACHSEQIPEKMSELKAPPMMKISAKIKHAFDNNKTQFVAFITDYIQDPSEEKAKCMKKAIKNFGLMPAIGKAMSKEEREVVSTWMYDNFDEKWKTKDCKSSDCKRKGKDKEKGKCGDGKCGSEKKADMNCTAAKCGAK